MPTVTELISAVGLDYLFNPHKRLYWGYLLSSLVIVWLYLVVARQPVDRVLDRRLWWHPSARLDYLYFFVVSLIKVSLILPWMLGVREVAFSVWQQLESWFGYETFSFSQWDRQWIVLAYTLTLFLSGDFTRYWLHRLMHSVPFLWEFHKVHHSAEVLTPITFYRVHPVENLLFGLRYSLSAGLVTGVFLYFFGAGLALLDVLGVNLFVYIAHVVGDNLRHSPVHLRYPRWLERGFISPAQHQYHHCVDGSRRNYGGVLAVWDWMFGSWRGSRVDDRYRFGIVDGYQFQSITGLLGAPFINLLNRIQRKQAHEQIV